MKDRVVANAMETLKKDNEHLRQQIELLQRQLKDAGQEAVEYMPLHEIKTKLRTMTEKLMNGDVSAEKEYETLSKAMHLHPDYIKEQEAEAARWESEQIAKCQEALATMRGYIPPNITNVGKKDLLAMGVPQDIVERVFSKKVLWIVRKDPRDVAKLHSADLYATRYNYLGLDLTEMRAVYAVLPKEFELDGDGKKLEWRSAFRKKLFDLTRQDAQNGLMPHQKRHSSYTKHAGLTPLFDGTTTVKAMAVKATPVTMKTTRATGKAETEARKMTAAALRPRAHALELGSLVKHMRTVKLE